MTDGLIAIAATWATMGLFAGLFKLGCVVSRWGTR